MTILLVNSATSSYNDGMIIRRPAESGQVLLITLLVLSIATTIGLSLIGRTTTDIAINTQLEESSQALAAAEAGIEEALKTGVGTDGVKTLTPNITYTVSVSTIGAATGVYQFPKKTIRGNVETLWLVNHNADGTLAEVPTVTGGSVDLCFSHETTTPAITFALFYKKAGVYTVARGAVDPDAVRSATNHFSGVTALNGGCGVSTMYRQLITFSDFGINPVVDTLLYLRVRPLYSDTQLAVNSGVLLPSQGSKIQSTGQTQTRIERKVTAFGQYRAPATIFDSAIYSQGSLSQ